MYSLLVTFTGGFGLFVTRIMKGNWSSHLWTYVPIFWIPVLFSWPVGLVVLFGGLDK
jgi:hypothetical protein